MSEDIVIKTPTCGYYDNSIGLEVCKDPKKSDCGITFSCPYHGMGECSQIVKIPVESIEGDVFSEDPDCFSNFVVGKHIFGGYDDYLQPLLEKFDGKRVRVTIEVL